MHCLRKAVVSEDTNPERSSIAVENFNGPPDINSLDVDQIVGERIEESLVSSDEVDQGPRVDEVGPEFDSSSVSALITDELLTTESPVIDHTVEGPQEEPAANDNASNRPENLSQANIMTMDETTPVEMQSINETKAPETHALNGNGHSTTTQETNGTHGMFLNPYITF